MKSAKVKRDKNGYWTHPEYPDWDESVTKAEVDSWAEKNNFKIVFEWFEYTASEEVADRYYEDGDIDISDWNPSLEGEEFLLSIHDTEDGPIAIKAKPI